MQRRSNIKHNSIGIGHASLVGCISLLCLLTITAIAPLGTSSVYADNNGLTENVCGEDLQCEISKVSIAFTQDSAPVTEVDAPAVTPIDGKGIKTHVEVGANIKVESSNGYRVYIGSNSQYLRKDGTSETDKIAPVNGECKDDGHEGKCTYNAMPVNQWGYAWTKGSTIDAETATYYAMPKGTTTTPFETVESKDLEKGTNGENGQDYAFAFAANINSNIPAGKYSNEVTLSVISDPLQTSKTSNGFGITTMQEMTSSICTNAADDAVAQLEDTRDHKFYWVGKMPDNRCWMTQNLDLDLSTSTALKGDTTNLGATKSDSVTWTPGKNTTSDKDTILVDITGQLSWSMGGTVGGATDYYTANQNSTTSCGTQLAGASACPNEANGKWTSMTIPTSANDDTNAHYLLGNLYQWCAATAGCKNSSGQTGSQFASGNAAADICPYGWKLPTSSTNGEFQKLSNALEATSGTATTGTVSKLTDAPFYAVRGGSFNQDTDYKFLNLGNNGYYWSSTALSGTSAYNISFYSTANVGPSNTATRQFGFSVRCINNPDVQ